MPDKKDPSNVLNKIRSVANAAPDFSTNRLYGIDFLHYKKLLQKNADNAFAFVYKLMTDKSGLSSVSNDSFYKQYYNNLAIQFNRFFRYLTYAQMVKISPEIAAAIDTYVDTCVQRDYLNRYFYFTKANTATENKASLDQTIEELYRLAADWHIDAIFLRRLFRFLVKYGDAFILIEYHNDNIRHGIKRLMLLPPYYVQAVYDKDGKLLGYNIIRNNVMIYYGSGPYIQDLMSSQSMPTTVMFDDEIYGSESSPMLSPLQVLHIKINEEEFSPYGSSILDDIRRVWKQLVMAEDLLLAFLFIRGVSRKIITVKLGNKPMAEALNELALVRKALRISPLTDTMGNIDSVSLIQTLSDDIFLPNIGNEDKYNISEWSAQNVDGFVKTIEYFKDKITTKLRIPPGMITMDKDINGKNTLETEIVAFARIIQSIQEEVADQLMSLFYLHYAELGEQHRLKGIKLTFTQPYLHKFEEARDNALKLRVDIAASLKQLLTDPEAGLSADMDYILENILQLPKEILRKAELEFERKQKMQQGQTTHELDSDDITSDEFNAEQGQGGVTPGAAPGSGLGGELGGEIGGMGGELGSNELGGLGSNELGGGNLAPEIPAAEVGATEVAPPPAPAEEAPSETFRLPVNRINFLADIINSSEITTVDKQSQSIFYDEE